MSPLTAWLAALSPMWSVFLASGAGWVWFYFDNKRYPEWVDDGLRGNED